MVHSLGKILIGGLTLVAAAPPSVPLRDGAGAIAGVTGPAVMLFWAAWCAPCRAEVANFAALERSAAPMKLIVIATDGSHRSRQLLRSVPADQLRFAADMSADVMTMLGDRGNGLPVALAIDGTGQICGAHQGGATPAELVQLRNQCLKKD